MGRRSHSQTLALWANGEHVGRWTVTPRGDMELQYDPAWRASAAGRPLSLSLPFNFNNEPLKGDNVAHYFEGLLPDSDAIRRRAAARFKTGSTRAPSTCWPPSDAIASAPCNCCRTARAGRHPTASRARASTRSHRRASARSRLPGPLPGHARPRRRLPDLAGRRAGEGRLPRLGRQVAEAARLPRRPRTSSSCRWAWSAAGRPTSAPRWTTSGCACACCGLRLADGAQLRHRHIRRAAGARRRALRPRACRPTASGCCGWCRKTSARPPAPRRIASTRTKAGPGSKQLFTLVQQSLECASVTCAR